MWARLLTQNLLYSTDFGKFKKLVTPSPNAPVVFQEAPGEVGNWLGWQIVKAYVKRHPEIRYLLGPVSISDAYPLPAKNMLVHFYRHYFGDETVMALARHRFVISEQDSAAQLRVFCGDNYEQDFRTLKLELGKHNLAVPVLYKQYTETYESGGVRFLDFNIDQKFSNCVDGLVLADLDKLKPAKRERYLGDKRSPLIVPSVV